MSIPGPLRTRTRSSARIAATSGPGQDVTMTDATDLGEGSSRTPAPARGRKRRRITEDLSMQTEDGADVETIHLPGESAPSPIAGPSHRSPTPSAALSGVSPPSPSPSVFELLSQPSEAFIELPSQPSESFIDLTADPPPRPPTPPPVPSRAQPLAEYNCPICFCPPTRATLMPCGHVCCGECLFTAVKTTQRRNTYVVDPRTNTAKCPVCRSEIKGWDGKGGGVIGLQPMIIPTV